MERAEREGKRGQVVRESVVHGRAGVSNRPAQARSAREDQRKSPQCPVAGPEFWSASWNGCDVVTEWSSKLGWRHLGQRCESEWAGARRLEPSCGSA